MRRISSINRGCYRLTDNFFRFWYAFGYANISQLEDGDTEGVYDYLVEPALHEFASPVFEDICREFVREQQKKNALPFRYTKMGRWWGKTTVRDNSTDSGFRVAETEIDLLAVGKDAKEYLDTAAKLSPLKGKAKFWYALFSETGFDDKLREEAGKSEGLYLYDLETIINCKYFCDCNL